MLNDIKEKILEAGAKVKVGKIFDKKDKPESLVKQLIENPDIAEVNIKKEGEEIVIRIRKAE